MNVNELHGATGKARLRATLPPALLLAASLAAVVMGCGEFPARDADPPAAELVARIAGQDEVRAADEPEPEEESDAAPAVIYYDLTGFDWYRRGEPILLEGRRYLPGRVEPTGERRFQREGAYDGVDYYVPRDAAQPHDTIYVPVYSGYWLPFALGAEPPASANQ